MREGDDGTRRGKVRQKEEGESDHRYRSEFSQIDASLRHVLDSVALRRYENYI
jgi:hypothetical protein